VKGDFETNKNQLEATDKFLSQEEFRADNAPSKADAISVLLKAFAPSEFEIMSLNSTILSGGQ
jgi:hypothetical protein